MSSNAPTAAWHPALMPNSAVDLIAKTQKDDRLPEAEGAQDIAAPALASTLPVSEPVDEHIHDTSGVDDWFPEYESNIGWTGQDTDADAAAVHEEASQAAEVPREEHSADTGDSTSAKAAKHASTISFARTVSHEVNWDGDDDDPEWDLPRTDTDPFKFMPHSDRSNSFPAVPPMAYPAEHDQDRPLPSSQVEEIMQGLDQEAGSVDDEARAATSSLPIGDDGREADDFLPDDSMSHQYTSGDLLASAEDGSGERYVEGVPLIPHTEAGDSPVVETNAQGHDPFTEGDDGDDFFNQIENAETPATTESPAEAFLERKSTMQVINTLTSNQASQLDSPLEAAEDADEPFMEEPTQPEIQPSHQQDIPSTDGQESTGKPGGGDLDAQWAAVFGGDDDDDDFLLEDTAGSKDVDPSAFLGEDDEGFLDDSAVPDPQPETTKAPVQPSSPWPAQPQAGGSRYLPTGATPGVEKPLSSPYAPYAATPLQPPVPAPFSQPSTAPPPSTSFGYGAPPPRPEPNKAASFADKSKGGYQSPYDLPMEVVKPRKRQSMQQLPKAPPAVPAGPPVAAPPRSSSMQVASPTRRPTSSMSPPPPSAHSAAPPPQAGGPPKPGQPPKKNDAAFFEDLPMSSKPRPASRHSQKSLPSPTQASAYGPPQPSPQGPPQMTPPGPQSYAPPPAPSPSAPQYSPAQPPAEIASLIAPPRVNPYAATPAAAHPPSGTHSAPPTSSRYSPAVTAQPPNGAAPVPPPSKYAAAPPPMAARTVSAGYSAAPASMPPPVLPHQPRTSSPLAHFEISHERTRAALPGHADGHHLSERRSSSSSSLFEPRLNRIPSLPPTKEDAEEDSPAQQPPSASSTGPPPSSAYSPHKPRQTPPPVSYHAHSSLSPPKKLSPYSPQSQPSALSVPHEIVPPQRSQTQSPGALYGNRSGVTPVDPIQRPSSVHDPTSPRAATFQMAAIPPPAVPTVAPVTRTRGMSQNLNLVPPTDGRQHDQLQRWKGAPLISWGVGGTLVTSFPKDVPRYGIGQALPMIVRSPGEVKVKNIKDLQPLDERLAKFPGPLKGKSKKKETLSWLSTGIETLERALPSLAFQGHVSHDDRRAVERVLLWKILRLFIEHDGVLEGNANVDKAVREVLSPSADAQQPTEVSPMYANGAGVPGFQESGSTQMQSDSVDSSTIEQIRKSLLTGDREKAVWDAADKRLWGHALLIAATASPELYKKVAQEFVRKEVNYPGHNNESLAALYEVLSGNHEECVDELVPVHARAGLQLVPTNTSSGQARDALAGLDKWRETLSLILSNRSVDDVRALNSLGGLLSGYGRAEAAHICFLFAKTAAVFGGLDDPNSSFVLIGADHKRQADQFAKETEALLLSEVYEYGLSLGGTSNVTASSPHLAAYKLQHAMTLAEYGYQDKALQYCEAISHAITSQTRRSPYHHPILESAVEDLMKRLREAPKEESSSWIPKPNMNKVSDSMWNRFNKLVSGEDNNGSGPGSDAEGAESGPFAHITGTTPTISRPPSPSGTTGMEMFGSKSQQAPSYPMANAPLLPPTATRTASRYAPATSQPATSPNPYDPNAAYTPAGRSSMERSSGEYNRASYELPRQSSEFSSAAGYSPSYVPNNAPISPPSHPDPTLGMSRESSYMPLSSQPSAPSQSNAYSPGTTSGYQPYDPAGGMNGSADMHAPPVVQAPPKEEQVPMESSYQPPSYGYEPPSITTSFEAPAAGLADAAPLTEPQASAAPEASTRGGFEPPSYQPYGYEPPSYNPDHLDESNDQDDEPKPKKKSFMDDDEDDIPALKPSGDKSKSDKDRENEEMFRKAAEEDAKRAEEEKLAKAKKGWGFGSWWGGGVKKEGLDGAASPNKPVRAKLGDKNAFVFDPELKRWVNKNASGDDNAAKKATPPPPRSAPRSVSGTPPPSAPLVPGIGMPPLAGRASAPPPLLKNLNPSPSVPNLAAVAARQDSLDSLDSLASSSGGPPAMVRSASNASAGSAPGGGPPSRPATSMSNASSIDDLLSAAGPRKPGGKKPRKSGRYVDVMAK